MIKNIYKWEIELDSGDIIREDSFKKFEKDKVVRVSFIPSGKLSSLLPRHDFIMSKDFEFVKRFKRVFMDRHNNIKECLHCLITNKFRVYMYSSTGRTLITDKNYELYI